MSRNPVVRPLHRLIPVVLLVVLLASAIVPGFVVTQAVVAGPWPWTPDTPILDDPDDQFYPAMATDSDGHLWTAFTDYDSSYHKYGIRFYESTNNGGTWADLGGRYDPAYNYFYPDIVVDPYDNKVYIVYERETTASNHDILCAIFIQGVGTYWDRQVDIDSDDDRYPSITCDYDTGSNNYVYVSYQYAYNYNDVDLMFARSIDHGQTWTRTKLAGESNEPDWDSVYCETDITYANGSLYLAYRHSEDYIPPDWESEIWVQISRDYGTSWTQIKVFEDSPKPVSNPSVAATHGGGAVMIAYEYAYSYSPADYDVRYAYSLDSGTTWSAQNVLANSNVEEWQPSLTVDGCGSTSNSVYGNIHAVYWKDYYVWHRYAAYNEPWVWSEAEQVSDVPCASHGYPGIGITTQERSGTWYPCAAWTDTRNTVGTFPIFDIYSSTLVGYPRWDINQDGKVDYKDLAILGAHYGQTTAPPYPAWDINQDGVVNYKDLAILGAHYGEVY